MGKKRAMTSEGYNPQSAENRTSNELSSMSRLDRAPNLSGEFIENPQAENVENKLLGDFLQTWLSLRGNYQLPEVEYFSLIQFEEHLPFIVLMDYHRDTDRFMIRFSGSHYVDGFGADNTGRFIDELTNTETLTARFHWLIKNKKPYWVTGTKLTWSPKDYRFFDAIVCPLFDDEGNVSSLLSRVDFIS